MLKMFKGLCFIAIGFMMLTSCAGKEKFTRQGWDDGDGIEFPRRFRMVDDLIENHKLKGLTYRQVIGLLKYPQRNSHTDRSFHYEIVRKMSGIDTIYTKNLVFYLNKDSVVTDFKITEKDYPRKKKKSE